MLMPMQSSVQRTQIIPNPCCIRSCCVYSHELAKSWPLRQFIPFKSFSLSQLKTLFLFMPSTSVALVFPWKKSSWRDTAGMHTTEHLLALRSFHGVGILLLPYLGPSVQDDSWIGRNEQNCRVSAPRKSQPVACPCSRICYSQASKLQGPFLKGTTRHQCSRETNAEFPTTSACPWVLCQ